MIRPTLRRLARRVLHPVLPGWPDEGRGIVQRPGLSALLGRALGGGRPPCRVLNAGAGEGLFSPLLLALPGVERLVEIDLSYGTHRRVLADPRQRAAGASLTQLPFSQDRFDLVLCSEVLEHIPDDGAAVAELARVLAPGGHLLVTVPTPPAVPDSAHVREGYTPAELDALLAVHGLVPLARRFAMRAPFRIVLARWRPGRWPRLAILALAWLDRLVPVGAPQDLMVLAVKPP